MNNSKQNNVVATFGELLLRLSTIDNQRFIQSGKFAVNYGGAESNVAIGLSHLGINTRFITSVPKNTIAKNGLKQLSSFNVDTNYIHEDGGRLGTYYFENGIGDRKSQVIYDREYSSIMLLQEGIIDWDKCLEGVTWFHWTGITPALSINAAKVCKEALLVAKEKNIIISCDLNYRSKLWKYTNEPSEIMIPLVELCDIVVAGMNDAEILLDIKFQEKDSYHDAPKRVYEKFPHLKLVGTSLRKSYSASHNSISAILFDGIDHYQSREFDIKTIVDRIGAGDAMMSGLIYSQLKNKSLEETTGIMAACSALKHTIPGDVLITTEGEIKELAKGEDMGLVSR